MEIKELKRDIENCNISAGFEERGKTGIFKYNLIGEDKGIAYCEYEEDNDEHIYAVIHDWVDRNVEVKIDITVKDLK
jgi:hypothetical protein